MTDAANVQHVLVLGATGITVKEPRTPLADGTRNVLAAMARHGVCWLVRMIQKQLLRWRVSRATVARYALEAAVTGRYANESLNMAEAA